MFGGGNFPSLKRYVTILGRLSLPWNSARGWKAVLQKKVDIWQKNVLSPSKEYINAHDTVHKHDQHKQRGSRHPHQNTPPRGDPGSVVRADSARNARRFAHSSATPERHLVEPHRRGVLSGRRGEDVPRTADRQRRLRGDRQCCRGSPPPTPRTS